MIRLRENDNNEIEAVAEDGAVVDKIGGWDVASPFFVFEREVASLAARHNASSFVEASGLEGPTIHEFLVDQEDLYNKAVHDLATDTEIEL